MKCYLRKFDSWSRFLPNYKVKVYTVAHKIIRTSTKKFNIVLVYLYIICLLLIPNALEVYSGK